MKKFLILSVFLLFPLDVFAMSATTTPTEIYCYLTTGGQFTGYRAASLGDVSTGFDGSILYQFLLPSGYVEYNSTGVFIATDAFGGTNCDGVSLQTLTEQGYTSSLTSEITYVDNPTLDLFLGLLLLYATMWTVLLIFKK